MMMIYMAHFRPMPTSKNNKQEVMQDSFMLLCAYHLLLFTDYLPDVELQYNLGWSYIFVITIMLSFNVYEFLGMAFRDCRRCYYQRKRQAILEKNKKCESKREELKKKALEEYN